MLRHSLCVTAFTTTLLAASSLLAQDDPFHGFDPFAEPVVAPKKETAEHPCETPAKKPVLKVQVLATSDRVEKAERPHHAISQGLPTFLESPSGRKIRQALKQHIDVELVNAPLIKFTTAVRQATGINFILDQPALDGVGIGSETLLTVSLKDVSLKSALRVILKDLELTYLIRDEVLQITTPEECECALFTRVYRVEDLIRPGKAEAAEGSTRKEFAQQQAKVEKIIELLTTTVSPESWDDVGGPGAMSHIFIRDKCLLVVTQDPTVHPGIAELLETLRNICLPPPVNKKTQPAPALENSQKHPPESAPSADAAVARPQIAIQQVAAGEESINRRRKPLVQLLGKKVSLKPEPYAVISKGVALRNTSSAKAKIEAALAASVAVDFFVTPLSDVAGDVSKATGIKVLLDRSALQRRGVDPQTPVTCSLSGVTLRNALELILTEMALRFVIDDDVMKITTHQKADSLETTRLYAIDDFAPSHHPDAYAEDLHMLVSGNISGDAWSDSRGSDIRELTLNGRCFLAIRTIEYFHVRIAGLLQTIRYAVYEDVPGR